MLAVLVVVAALGLTAVTGFGDNIRRLFGTSTTGALVGHSPTRTAAGPGTRTPSTSMPLSGMDVSKSQ